MTAKRLITLTGVLAISLLPIGSAEAKKRFRPCSAKPSATVVANNFVRVVSVRRNGNVYSYACTAKRRFQLASVDASFGYGTSTYDETVAGHFVAFTVARYDDSERYNPDFKGFMATIEVLDTRTGAHREAAAISGAANGESNGIVVNEVGSVAWIGSDGSKQELRTLVGSTQTLVDSGLLGSLALGGRTIYWQNAGVARSAPLS